MPEREYRHAPLQRIKDVVASGDPELSSAFNEVVLFLWQVSEEREKPRESRNLPQEPEVLEHPLFSESLSELGGKNPLLALRTTIEGLRKRGITLGELEKGTEDTEKVPRSTRETMLIRTLSSGKDSLPNTESTRKKKKRTEITPPWGFALRVSILDRVSHVPQKVMKEIFKAAEKEREGINIFYNEEQVLRAVARWKLEQKRKPQPEKVEKMPKEQDPKFGTFTHLRRLTGLSPVVLRSIIKEVPSKREKGQTTRYDIESVLEKAATPPPSADKNGLYVDKNTESIWIPESRITARTGLSRAEWKELLPDTSSQLIIAKNGRLIPFYDETELKLRSAQKKREEQKEDILPFPPPPKIQVVFLAPEAPPQAEPVAKPSPSEAKYVEPRPIADRLVKDDIPHISIGALRRDGVKLTHYALHELLADMDGIPAQAKNRREIMLYPEEEARARIKEYQKKAEEDASQREERKRKKPDPKIYASRTAVAAQYGISPRIVDKLLASQDDPTWYNARYYKKNEAKKVIESYLEERANEEGIRVIKGKKKVPLNYLHLKTGFGFSTLRTYLAGLDTVEDLSLIHI